MSSAAPAGAEGPPRRAPPALVLASASAVRAALLRNAGVPYRSEAAAIDETELKRALRAEGARTAEAAETLAELKALKVSHRHPGALVIGADQMLECGGEWFDKPADRDHARAHLIALRGKTHTLVSAAVVARDGALLWHHVGEARLAMRDFSDRFLDFYMERAGEAACGSVGAYQLEGLGAQLFARIEGDYFTILGLPLLPLLDFLRSNGAVPA
jgi:septum formation protein